MFTVTQSHQAHLTHTSTRLSKEEQEVIIKQKTRFGVAVEWAFGGIVTVLDSPEESMRFCATTLMVPFARMGGHYALRQWRLLEICGLESLVSHGLFYILTSRHNLCTNGDPFKKDRHAGPTPLAAAFP